MAGSQEHIDRFYFAHGKCCAGCDWWHHVNSVAGYCQRMPAEVVTTREHVCVEFKDEFNWSYCRPTIGGSSATRRHQQDVEGATAMQLMCCEDVIENEIKQKVSQKGVGLTYAMAIRSHAAGRETDWPRINKAIFDRWGIKGLVRVKDIAWKHLRDAEKARTART